MSEARLASKRILVLQGGQSAEREISLMSGKAVADALSGLGHRVAAHDPGGDPQALLAALFPAPDVVFNALHGTDGEDGRIQGLLDLAGVAYTHSGVLASALAMDKGLCKRLLASNGVRVPDGIRIPAAALRGGVPFDRPYVVKPNAEGSSVGVVIVRETEAAPTLPLPEWPEDRAILVERYVPGRELTVGVMGDRALGVTEIRAATAFYDYRAKYTEGGSDHILPAQVPDAVAALARDWALTAHRELGCRGISRSDFRWDDRQPGTDGLYFLEINTQPGLTPYSLIPEQAAATGLDFAALCQWMVEDAQCRP